MTKFIHIGLHKTGTTYFQNAFAQELSRKICFNPLEVMKPMYSLFKSEEKKPEEIARVKKIIAEANLPDDVLFYGAGFSQLAFLNNFEENAALLKEFFPSAKIMVFLRFQTNWVLSAYNHAIHIGHFQPIQKFLNYNKGKFERSSQRYNKNNLLQLDVYRADWSDLLGAFISKFGKENVHVFFYEDFKKNNAKVLGQFFQVLGDENDMKIKPTPVNRSYSALLIYISIYLSKFLSLFGAEKLLREFHPKPKMTWKVARKKLPFYKLVFDGMIRVVTRVRYRLSWRRIMQGYVGRMIYIDWDLLKKDNLRNKLDTIFHEKNKRLLKYIPADKMPKNYLDEQ